MSQRYAVFRIALSWMVAALSLGAAAEPVATARGGGSSMTWEVHVAEYASTTLRVAAPDGVVRERRFRHGETVLLRIQDLGERPPEGQYNWELLVTPNVSEEVARALRDARAEDDDEAIRRIMAENGLTVDRRAWGGITVSEGAFVETDRDEPQGAEAPEESVRDSGSAPPRAPGRSGRVGTDDEVIPDDLIVQGSACVGFDCVNGESFGFDTIRMKEHNLRVHFDDTSVAAGFPTTQWRVVVNDSNSGGLSRFSIEDSDAAKVPLTVEANSTTNSVYVDSTGKVGFRTSTPVLDLHVHTSNTPAVRLDQNNTGGFAAQIWDIGANEANFFIRDVTNFSRLPFRIRPGAPTSSIDINASGTVGINDASPNSNAKLDLAGAQRFEGVGVPTIDNAAWLYNESGIGFAVQAGGSVRVKTGGVTSDRLTVTTAGDVGINCNAPTADFVIFGTSNCSGSGSTINAGATQFTVTSSRALKENLEKVAVPDLLERIAAVDVYTYDFKEGAKDRLGLMAEDFHGVLGRGSDKLIDGHDVQMALWMAVQQLAEQNKQMRAQNEELQERLTALEERLKEQQ